MSWAGLSVILPSHVACSGLVQTTAPVGSMPGAVPGACGDLMNI